MLHVNCASHSDYQNFVLENLRLYYPNPASIAHSTWDIIDRFWKLDLSCMQRSYLLSIDFKVSSLTDWTAQLKINPLFAILSGFEFEDTSGVDIRDQPYGSLFTLYQKEFLDLSVS